jgi:hypothetical protein
MMPGIKGEKTSIRRPMSMATTVVCLDIPVLTQIMFIQDDCTTIHKSELIPNQMEG